MNAQIRSRPRLGTVIALVIGLLVLVVLSTRRSQTLVPHQTLQFDDFFFTVEDVVKQPVDPARTGTSESPVGEGEAGCLVRLRVENRALRVPFKFSGRSLAFVDLSGRRPVVTPSSERLPSGDLTAPILHELRAGESATYEYLVAIPADSPDLRLRIMPGGWTGDLLDWLLFGRKEFRLF